MDNMHNKKLGTKGEGIAAAYLKMKGYKILERQFSIRFGEVDIIAEKKGTIVFVEVKTRKNNDYGAPSEAVTYTKQKRIIQCAKVYMQRYPDSDARFDVIEIITGGCKIVSVNHIENAFLES